MIDEKHCLLDIKVKARAKKNLGISFKNDMWVVSVSESPVNGEANDAVIRFLSKALGVPQMNISIVRGHTNQYKTVRIESLELAEIVQKLNNII